MAEEKISTFAEALEKQKGFQAVRDVGAAPAQLSGELKEAYVKLVGDAKAIAESTRAAAEHGLASSHSVENLDAVASIYTPEFKKLELSKTFTDAAEAVNSATTPASEAIGSIDKIIEGLEEGEELSKKKLGEIESILERASKSLSKTANGAKASLARNGVNVIKAINTEKEAIEAASKGLADTLKLGDMAEAINEVSRAEVKTGEDVLKYLETGSSKLFGMPRVDSFKATINHVYNPFAESTQHVIGNAKNEIGGVKRAFNAGVSVAGAGLIGDAIFRAKNSEGEERSTPGRVVEAAIGLGTLVTPVARAIH